MGRVAYGDESIRRAGVPEPMYLLGAYVAEDGQQDLVDALSSYPRSQGKLHWRDSLPLTKRAVCQTIGGHDASLLVVVASPLPVDGGEERARRRALLHLAWLLEGEFDVHELVLERRQRNQDEKDRRAINSARHSRALASDFRLRHEFGRIEKRLWVPDQVIGALGDYLADSDTGWGEIADRVRVEQINLP